MPNPIDPDEFRPALPGESDFLCSESQSLTSVPVVVYFGQLNTGKGTSGIDRRIRQLRTSTSISDAAVAAGGRRRHALELQAAGAQQTSLRGRFGSSGAFLRKLGNSYAAAGE